MAHLAVTAVGADRPGIVAAVTGVLVRHGCNLEDTSMSILRGHFAMMLVVDGPAGLDPAALEAALAEHTAAFDLLVVVRPIHDAGAAASPEGEEWTFSVYGADRPGIVHGVASALADKGINIVDLTTRLTSWGAGGDDTAVYAMVLEVTIPPGTQMREVGMRMAELGAELGVEISMNPNEADIL